MQKKEITEIFRKYKSDNEIFHDLMPVRTREILLVATIYDAFILEQDGLLSDIILGGYYQLSLSNAPRITNVSSTDEAMKKLKSRRYDLVIVMSRLSQTEFVDLSRKVDEFNPNLPILLLLNDNAEIGEISARRSELLKYFNNIFVWNGHSEIFLAMIKYAEDKINVYNDTHIGLTRVILLVEDSIRYYSRYLPLLYSEIMKQARRLVNEEENDEIRKALRMRARPKVLLASTYEEAISIFDAFKDYLLCVISDVKFPMGGVIDEMAGIKLIKELKVRNPDLPILLQSSDSEHGNKANPLGAAFINKNSDRLATELTSFFFNNLGFGDFIFRNNAGHEIARASTMEDLKAKLNRVPAESIIYHASRNHFSAWLMARGEIQISQVVLKTKVTDFKTAEDLRTFLINVGEWVKKVKTQGKIVPFDEAYIGEDRHILRLAEGSIGGKGRGIAFMNSLLNNAEIRYLVPDVNIKIPQTAVIGISEFSNFIEKNKLLGTIHEIVDYDVIKRRFLMGNLSNGLQERLKQFLDKVRCPLAVRSSGLLEDSLSHPLSGLYQTYFLPNNHEDATIRLSQLMEAIKLVYASVYSRSARAYFEAIDYKVEEERMAIIIQQVVGKGFGSRYYPHISGVAQSYNYYPFSYLKPQDGVAMIALGLGKYVVGGEQSFRFCPAYPQLDMMTHEEKLRNTQQHFYAIDLTKNTVDLFNGDDATLLTLDLAEAGKDGMLDSCASTWDVADGRLREGVESRGPRVLNFPYIIKYEQFPLSTVLKQSMEIIKDSMETPVEIEFAVDLHPDVNGKPTFYLLQIKHLLREAEGVSVDIDAINRETMFLLSRQGMGNGRVEGISDIVWIDPATFDKSTTRELATELETLNDRLKLEGKKYVLLGPGRWGTRDRWLGIPISWPQISHAKVIVEYAIEGFQIDASLGSHFFHNVTSLNIGYFSIPLIQDSSFIDWPWIRTGQEMSRSLSLVHTRLEKPVSVTMDGRNGIQAIFK